MTNKEGFGGKDLSKALIIATGLPVMVILGVIVGYYLGQDYGNIGAGVGALVGGILGLAWAVIEVFRWYPDKQKEKQKE